MHSKELEQILFTRVKATFTDFGSSSRMHLRADMPSMPPSRLGHARMCAHSPISR